MEKNKNGNKRRVPGESVRNKPQKAPPVRPRKHAPVQEPARAVPEVVYQQPKPFSRSRLILRLVTVVAVVVALMLALSIFFKVENIEISGCDKYTAYQIQQASGIEQGSQLLTFSHARAAGKILTQLPYVRSVRIDVSLPDTVKIEIVESAVAYAVEDQSGLWWLVDCDGKVLEQAASVDDQPVISGVVLSNPQVGAQAMAYESATETVDDEGNVIPVTVTAAQRLAVAVAVTQNLEANRIYGEVTAVDVANIYDVVLWYGSTYKILMGQADELDYRIALLKAAVDACAEQYPNTPGEIDISEKGYYSFQAFTE